ncbi:SDR family NAD(P)-dependent oxidoreductase [Pseudomonas sp. NA-150]|uniref:SDR family NAD(P)-dependent oxidoreductase n=1 Tax=Pseudomonas sp. NA-150 TaxID=3367525 RepID=UPI0037CA07CE
MNDSTKANNKGTAVVTGASAGLGKVYADRLAQRGFDLVLVARSQDKLESLAAGLRSDYGVAVRTLVADLSAETDLEKVAADISADASITLLVNNAGASTLGSVFDLSDAKRDEMNKVNVTALVRLSHAIVPQFKARDRGTLINIGSVLGFFNLPISTVYSGTKGYVASFTHGLQQEVAETKVVVQLVLPAATATDIWEKSGVPITVLDPASVMTPEDCVDAALAGLDLGEAVTLPAVENAELYAAYQAAAAALFGASQNGKPASRYGIKH